MASPDPHSEQHPEEMRIVVASRAQLDLAVSWAAEEGWNPGLHDADAFHAQDPEGFFLGYLGDDPVASVSSVAYEGGYGFMGFYIVRPGLRHHGFGMALYLHARARLEGRNVGLDGVLEQEANYRKTGYVTDHLNARQAGIAARSGAVDSTLVPAGSVPFDALVAYDRRVFGFPRERFLRPWIDRPGTVALASVERGEVRGYGVLRPCVRGWKFGPLFSDGPERAEALARALIDAIPEGAEYFLDTPECNAPAMELARKLGLSTVFQTARMYSGGRPACDLESWYGVTTFELG